jgi:hypothetical protein
VATSVVISQSLSARPAFVMNAVWFLAVKVSSGFPPCKDAIANMGLGGMDFTLVIPILV